MRPTAILLCLSTILPAARGIQLHEPREAAPRAVKFDLQRNEIADRVAHDRNRFRKRDETVSAALHNEQTLYALNLTIGTPEQHFQINIDTGSSDLWVNTEDSTFCSGRKHLCKDGGTYNANSSSTYEYLGSWFNISYVDGSGASGDYVTDTVRIAGQTIKDFQFGVGYKSSSPQGILGIGYPINEAQVAKAGMKSYQNLPAKLTADGTISTSAFSLWLNDLDSNRGNLLFGGVDRAQYVGDLVTVSTQKTGDVHAEFYITMTGLDLNGTTVRDGLALAVLLDSGTSLTYLPNDMTAMIYDAVGAAFDESQGSAIVPCSLADTYANITFHFSEPAAIDVPLNEMVLDVLQNNDQGGESACLFGIAPSSGGSTVLGDTFLRSAYVVFDMENNEVSLAQSNLNATDTDVVEIRSGKDGVPSAADASADAAATEGLPAEATGIENGEGGGNGGGDGQDGSGDDSGVGFVAPSRGGLAGSVLLGALIALEGFIA